MQSSFSTYFTIIAAPVLILITLDLTYFVFSVRHFFSEKKKSYKELLFPVFILMGTLFMFRARLLPTLCLVSDFNAQTCSVEGTVTGIEVDTSYDHNNYYGYNITIDSKSYYVICEGTFGQNSIFYEGILRQGAQVKVEYLPRSRMIVSCERRKSVPK